MIQVALRGGALLLVAAMCATSSGVTAQGREGAAQGRGAGRGQLNPRGPLTPRQVQAEFDRYTIDQAQDALQLSDEQYPRFVRHVRSLQQARRQSRAQRTQLLMQLTQLLRTRPSVDEARLAAATRAVDDHERATVAEIQKAYAAVDEVLTPRQRARFRVLEDQLEQKMFEMLVRARQGPRR
jgi:Spy/CpxP family protein refolding chaperone